MTEPQPSGNLKWMYKGLEGHVDKEEYLMGRRVDKTFEIVHQKGDLEAEDNVVPPSLLRPEATDHRGLNVTVDAEAKLREDPLYEIRKKEIEARKEILSNPVRVMKIRKLLEQALSDSDSDSDRDSRKRHSKKKKHRSRDRSSERRSHHRDRSSDRRNAHDRHRKDYEGHSHNSQSHKRRSRSPSSRNRERRERSRSKEHEHSYERKRDVQQVKQSSDIKPTSAKSLTLSRHTSVANRQSKTKLSAEELERRRLEMMTDAQKREEERKDRVQRYKKEDKDDEEKKTDKSWSNRPKLM
ncbi:Pre-mRNA-splicing factor CWC25 -like protein [Halotydeus destructor]|nr:Pre-mRNA-splicing factor CWC25 -like protein [Halotydeus destructor]